MERSQGRWKTGWIVLYLTVFLPGAAIAQSSASQLLQPLDNTGGSARAMAMGSAYVAVSDDVSALLWNPAGLGGLSKGEVALHHDLWLVDTYQDSLVMGLPMVDIGGLAAMVSYLDYGNFAGRDAAGTPTTDYAVNKWGFLVGWGKEWSKGFSLGAALRGNIQGALGQSYGLLSGDLGVLYSPESRLRLGVSLVDLGGNQAEGWVASAIRAGLSFKQDLGGAQVILLALGGTWEPQGENRVEMGAEYSFDSRYFLRAGSQVLDQDNELRGLQSFTAGAGVRFDDLQLDYAFLPYGDLGTSHRVSLRYQFAMDRSPEARPSVRTDPVTAQGPVGPPPAAFKPATGTEDRKNSLVMDFDEPPDEAPQTTPGPEMAAEVLKSHQAATERDPKSAKAWWTLGNDYFKMGLKTDALRCFEEVLKIQPDNKAFADWLKNYKGSN